MGSNWWLLLSLLAACKGGAKSSTAGSAAPGSAAPAVTVAADAAVVTVADAAVAIDAALDDPRAPAARCAVGCLYLLDVPLADAKPAFERDCKREWPYAADDCEGLLYARNCIYAGFGNVFKRPEWKQRFETQPWYRAKPGFKERDFSPVALANVRALVAASKACEAARTVTAEDIELATRAFDALRAGQDFPAVAMEAEDRQAFAGDYDMYGVVERSKFEYVEPRTPEDGHRAIAIEGLEYLAGPGSFDPDRGVTLVFDAEGRLIEAY